MTLINLDNEAEELLNMVGRTFGVVRDEREAVQAFLNRVLELSRQTEATLGERAAATYDRIKRRHDEDLEENQRLYRQLIANQKDLQRMLGEFLDGYTPRDGEEISGGEGERLAGEEERERKVIGMTMNAHAGRHTGTEG